LASSLLLPPVLHARGTNRHVFELWNVRCGVDNDFIRPIGHSALSPLILGEAISIIS